MKIDKRYVRIASNLAFALVGGFLVLSIWHLVAKDTSWAPGLVFGLETQVSEEDRNVAAEAYTPPFPPSPIRASQIPTLFKSGSSPRPRPRVTPTPVATHAPPPSPSTAPRAVTPPPATRKVTDPVIQKVNRAKALFDAERYDDAEQAFKKITDKHKRLATTVANMFYKQGMRMAAKNKHEDAIDLYKRAMHFQFDNSRLHSAMVTSCKALNMWDRVSYHQKKAIAFKKQGK